MATNNDWNSPQLIPVSRGGLGKVNPTAHGVLVGNGTNAVTSIAVATDGKLLVSGGSGAAPSWVTPTASGGVTVTTNASTLQYSLTIPITVSRGGTGATSFTPYGVICGGTTTTGALQNAGTGTSTQVLTYAGPSSLPTWAAAPSVAGSWVQLGSVNITGNAANATFTTQFTSTYLNYLITFNAVRTVTSGAVLQMTFSTNNGTSYLSTLYQSGCLTNVYNSATLANSNSTTLCPMTSSSGIQNGNPQYSGLIYLDGMASSTISPIYRGNYFSLNNAGNIEYGTLGGMNSTLNVNAVKFAMSSGNIGGKFTLYGLTV